MGERLARFTEIPYVSSREDATFASTPKHISASSLKLAVRCLEQYRQRYVMGRKEPPGGARLWGTAHHATFEYAIAEKLRRGEWIGVEDVKALFAANLDELVDTAGGASQVKWGDSKEWQGVAPADAHALVKDRGVLLAQHYRETRIPSLDPTHAERPFEIRVPGVPVPVVGQIDVEAKVADESFRLAVEAGAFTLDDAPERILDQKTSGRSELSGDNRFQGWVYQLERPVPVDVDLCMKPSQRSKQPKVVTHTVPVAPERRTVAMIQRTILAIVTAFETLGPEQPWPDAILHPWACGYCGFRDTCPWWQETGTW